MTQPTDLAEIAAAAHARLLAQAADDAPDDDSDGTAPSQGPALADVQAVAARLNVSEWEAREHLRSVAAGGMVTFDNEQRTWKQQAIAEDEAGWVRV